MFKRPLYCPRCGEKAFSSENHHRYLCNSCGFVYFHNAASATSLILRCKGDVLFSVRGREPAKGYLDFPGGFVDPNESLETGLSREISEELSWEMREKPRYLFSFPNTYEYESVTYRTVDSFFLLDIGEKPTLTAQDDVADLRWVPINDVLDEDLAFDSMKLAVGMLRKAYASHTEFT